MENAATVLAMKFKTDDSKTRVVNLQFCKPAVTEAQVKALMDSMITGGAFAYQPTEKLGASMIQRAAATLF